MNRSHSSQTVILRTNRIGDMHRGVVMLTPEEGLVRAIAHGANSARGKLRGSTVPFCSGRAYFYTNPATGSTKITEMDATEYFSGIRADLKKFYTASLWSELILKTYASGGSSGDLYALFRSALGELDRRPASAADLISIHYLWRFLELSGSQPDLNICACSGEFIPPKDPAWYSRTENGFCTEAYADQHAIRWSSGALAFLRHTAELAFEDAIPVTPPAESVQVIKRVLYAIIQDLVEAPLNTIRTGAGII